MKIRTGFVSNSSSSSFCIIGVSNPYAIKELMKKDGFTFKEKMEEVSWTDRYGRRKPAAQYKKEVAEAKVDEGIDYDQVDYNQGFWAPTNKEPSLLYLGGDDEPCYAGLNAEPLLQANDMPSAKAFFKDYVKDTFNISLNIKEIEFIYGEIGS